MIHDKSVNEHEIQKLTEKERGRVKLYDNIIKSQSHRSGGAVEKRVQNQNIHRDATSETKDVSVGDAKSQNFDTKKFSVIASEKEKSSDKIMALLIKRFQNKNRELE